MYSKFIDDAIWCIEKEIDYCRNSAKAEQLELDEAIARGGEVNCEAVQEDIKQLDDLATRLEISLAYFRSLRKFY